MDLFSVVLLNLARGQRAHPITGRVVKVALRRWKEICQLEKKWCCH